MTNNKVFLLLLSCLVPALAFGAGGASSTFLYALMAIGSVTILFGIYALLRSAAALKQLNEAVAQATPKKSPTKGNDALLQATSREGLSSTPSPDEGFSGSDFSKGLDVFDDEKDLLIDHEYDGIQELNNNLPPWWVGLFWIMCIIGVVYFTYYHILTDWSSAKQFQEEMAMGQAEVDAYVKAHGGAISESTVTLLEDDASLAAGKAIYETNCVACHLADGGGIVGPNLTDNYWIHGPGIKDVFKVVKNGGRPGEGMVAWKAILSGKEMQQVASYVLVKLHGTTPANPKDPQGELYTE